MDSKVIVITGATGGLGKAMVKHFEQQNVRLALHTFQQEPFDVACEHAWFKADLRDAQQIDTLIASILANFGRIDVLINNAGVSKDGMSWKLSDADFNEVIAVNLTAPFKLMKGFLPKMRELKSGRIIAISSVVAQTGVVGTAAYAASKAGLIGLTKTVSKETATSGITVNCLALGYFEVGMIDEVNPEMQTKIIQSIPQQRLGSVATVLGTIDWLISDNASYITGQTISLNGGLFN
jgi:NAD(P)-dependent dehydrogenase (short-subunit alcohol dehydrogenase family)